MKKFTLTLLLFVPLLAFSQSQYPVGKISKKIFFSRTNKADWEPQYNKYNPNPEAVKFLKKRKKSIYRIKMVMGFWCDDSKVYVPQVLKTLDEAKWDTESSSVLKIFGVDENKEAGFEGFQALNIIKVPTIIVYAEDTEIGRIEELPKISVEDDLVNIIKSVEN